MEILLTVILWVSYYFSHSFLASLSAKRFTEEKLNWTVTNHRLFYSTSATVGFILLMYHYYKLDNNTSLIVTSSYSKITGYSIAFFGLIIIFISSRAFHFLSFFGLASSKLPDSNALYKKGIYSLIRHPLYSGTLMLFWGNWLTNFSAHFLAISTVTTIYVFVGIYFEEQKLVLQFGDEYLLYKNKTKRLIPYFV